MNDMRVFFRPIAALLLCLGLMLPTTAAFAVNPDEVLADPVLEKRARDISGHLRCMVCQNESIDDSNADLARDLRLLVRDRLTAGDSDAQVYDFLVARYGEFVLLKPRFNEHTFLLWAFPVLVLLAGLAAMLVATRRRNSTGEAPLNASEKAEIDNLLADKD